MKIKLKLLLCCVLIGMSSHGISQDLSSNAGIDALKGRKSANPGVDEVFLVNACEKAIVSVNIKRGAVVSEELYSARELVSLSSYPVKDQENSVLLSSFDVLPDVLTNIEYITLKSGKVVAVCIKKAIIEVRYTPRIRIASEISALPPSKNTCSYKWVAGIVDRSLKHTFDNEEKVYNEIKNIGANGNIIFLFNEPKNKKDEELLKDFPKLYGDALKVVSSNVLLANAGWKSIGVSRIQSELADKCPEEQQELKSRLMSK